MTPNQSANRAPSAEKLEELRARFKRLSQSDPALAPGYQRISQGLGELLDALFEPTRDGAKPEDPARLELLSRGLGSLADLLESAQPAAASVEGAQPASGSDPADRFREMFREEARRRLSALSLTMMGIYDPTDAPEALIRTGEHLHALRGGAAMVGLNEIADLVRAMELVVGVMKAEPAEERAWPTHALVGGFQLLEGALHTPELKLDAARAGETVAALRRYLAPGDTAGQPKLRPRALTPSAPGRLAQPSTAQMGNKRILVVDDLDTAAASIGFVLADLAVPIDTASHGAEALQMLRARPYSLIVSDVDMPKMDGVALTRLVRQDPAMREIPVILLTSLDRPDERDAGLEAGATDYVIKGAIGGGELLQRVRELLLLAPDAIFARGDVEPERLRVLIAEDVETIAASIAFVLADGPFEIDIARDGRAALERLRREHFDLLLSDVEMPEMGGLELLEAVREDDRLLDLPVIILTSVQDPSVHQDALNRGADQFLIKGEVGAETLRQILLDAARARVQRAQMEVIELGPARPEPRDEVSTP